jgi:hypothetical protein
MASTLASNAQRKGEQVQHLEWLSDFMEKNFKGLNKIYDSLVTKGGLIEFKHIQIIFEAESIVVAQKNGVQECYLLRDISEELENKEKGLKYVEMRVFSWRYNGFRFGLSPEILKLESFPGRRKITELEYFPLQHLPAEKQKALVTDLVARGHKWVQYVNTTHFEYKGMLDQNAITYALHLGQLT